MSASLRHIYAEKAVSQIPRLLSLLDRNPFSPTYGCFKRTYWLDKVDDFPDALPQFGVLSLALVYSHEMPFEGHPASAEATVGRQGKPGNIYRGQPRIREWILAGMRYWTTIQHRDGSFDEFYPNEHGWTGPTGFLLYAMLKSYLLLEERKEFPEEFRERFFTSCRKAADYIIAWDEHGVLANHHAMGVLPVAYAHHVLGGDDLKAGYEKKLQEFLIHCNPEGWSLEYDGADIGYLSATVSFLGKAWKLNRDPRLLEVMKRSTEFLSYFVYPNGSYAGSMGSRQTLHFYSHGCELLAPVMPLAGRIADRMLESLHEGKIVPAEIMPDRYFLYRIPEHLESYVDYVERQKGEKGQGMLEDLLPYERPDFRKIFPEGRFYVEKRGNIYLVANAAKGGVLRIFRTDTKEQILHDCGWIGRLQSGDIATSQWIDEGHLFTPNENGFTVTGAMHRVPAHKLFTPLTNIIFRSVLLLVGWHTGAAYWLKGFIRRTLMLGSRRVPVRFERAVQFSGDTLSITDTVTLQESAAFEALQHSGDFSVRYVPQSRYFQTEELASAGELLTTQEISTLNHERSYRRERVVH